MLKNISVSKLDIDNFKIIDLRSREKYNTSHIKNSINIEMSLLLANPNKYLNKNEEYYLYCQHGKTSVKVCIALFRMGYNVTNVMGGYDEWLLSNKIDNY